MRLVEAQRAAGAERCLQSFAQAVGIVFDHGRGGIENGLRGAVIFLEANELGAGKILGEALQIAGAGAAPAVDGLVFVADDADVLARAGQQADQFFLRAVGVLKFVDHDVLKARLQAARTSGCSRSSSTARSSRSSKSRAAALRRIRCRREKLRRFPCAFVASLLGIGSHLLRRDAVIFGVADLRRAWCGREILGGQIELRRARLTAAVWSSSS